MLIPYLTGPWLGGAVTELVNTRCRPGYVLDYKFALLLNEFSYCRFLSALSIIVTGFYASVLS
ncbi:MAG: hypothetical protein C0473_02980 [Cyanobacteria bacterium DS3.002]|nr:hypothetical protein [Cyanobacteria bacterium DS3.002]